MRILFGLFILGATLSVLNALADPSLLVIRHPASHEYQKDVLKTSDLENVLLALNGLPVQNVCLLFLKLNNFGIFVKFCYFDCIKEVEWTGLKNSDPFTLPKATLLFLADRNKVESSLTENSQIIPVKEVSFFILTSQLTRST